MAVACLWRSQLFYVLKACLDEALYCSCVNETVDGVHCFCDRTDGNRHFVIILVELSGRLPFFQTGMRDHMELLILGEFGQRFFIFKKKCSHCLKCFVAGFNRHVFFHLIDFHHCLELFAVEVGHHWLTLPLFLELRRFLGDSWCVQCSTDCAISGYTCAKTVTSCSLETIASGPARRHPLSLCNVDEIPTGCGCCTCISSYYEDFASWSRPLLLPLRYSLVFPCS